MERPKTNGEAVELAVAWLQSSMKDVTQGLAELGTARLLAMMDDASDDELEILFGSFQQAADIFKQYRVMIGIARLQRMLKDETYGLQ